MIFSEYGTYEIPGTIAQFSGTHFPVGMVAQYIYLGHGCVPISLDLTGKIGLVDRGLCFFDLKYRYIIEAGGSGMIVMDHNFVHEAQQVVMVSSSNQPHWVKSFEALVIFQKKRKISIWKFHPCNLIIIFVIENCFA